MSADHIESWIVVSFTFIALIEIMVRLGGYSLFPGIGGDWVASWLFTTPL